MTTPLTSKDFYPAKEYRREDYITARQRRQDGTDWVRSPAPLRPYWFEAGRLILLIIMGCATLYVWSHLAEWVK